MKTYFLSCVPCELTLNGVFFGVVDNFERFAEVNLSDKIFAKFTPQAALPVGLFLDDELLVNPPPFCEVYLLKDGVAIYIKEFPPLDYTLVPITQKRFGENLVTVFRQGAIHLSLQTSEGFFISTLPPSFAVCELSCHGDLFFIQSEKQLAIYTKGGKRVFLEEFLAFDVTENELNATLPLSDSLNRVADCRWALDEHGLTQTQFTLRQSAERAESELVAYAFFESVLLGAPYQDFLAEELLPQAEKLISFLGPFEGVTLTADPYTCGLVKKKGERVFELAYFTVVMKNNKIFDIKQ